MNKATRKVKVIYYDGYRDYQLVGAIGMATESNKYGNVMFYPDCGSPYRICLSEEQIEDID